VHRTPEGIFVISVKRGTSAIRPHRGHRALS